MVELWMKVTIFPDMVHINAYEHKSVYQFWWTINKSSPALSLKPHMYFLRHGTMSTYYSQSTYIYRAPQYRSPRWHWDSPTPLAASECALPRGPKGGGAHSPAAKGVGESQFQRLEKRLALCLLCGITIQHKKMTFIVGCGLCSHVFVGLCDACKYVQEPYISPERSSTHFAFLSGSFRARWTFWWAIYILYYSLFLNNFLFIF